MASVHRILDRAIASLDSHGATPRLIAWTLAVHISTVGRHIAAVQAQISVRNPDAPRLPRTPLTLEQQCTLIALYCQSTPPPGMQRWALRTAAKKINADPALLGRTVQPSTIGRVLERNQLRPHRSAYFLHIRDPMFFEKMHHVLAVYAKESNWVFCFDECPNIQAISRSGPDVPGRNGSTNREFVYQRNGTIDLFGFLHVSTGRVSAYCRPSHETATLIEVFTAHVRSQPPGEQLHYICDNLSPHFNEGFCKAVAKLCELPCPSPNDLSTGEKRRQWLQREDKRLAIHFLPFHGSWLNQVEVWFGLLRRYALVGSWFGSVDALIDTILAFAPQRSPELTHLCSIRMTHLRLGDCVALLRARQGLRAQIPTSSSPKASHRVQCRAPSVGARHWTGGSLYASRSGSILDSVEAFAGTWDEQLAHPFNFQDEGRGLENLVLRRFSRILSQRPEKLAQLDSKFLADLSLLCVRLIDHHRQNVSHDDWNALTEAVKARKLELDEIIAADTGPKRQPRARRRASSRRSSPP